MTAERELMLTEDQKEALREIANIGMGQAGSTIAQVLGEFVQLSIPRILIVPPKSNCCSTSATFWSRPASAASPSSCS